MPSIYIAGPMTGIPEFNFPAFDEAKKDLERDWNVISPADMDREIGFEVTHEVTPEFLRDAMRRDINAVMHVDALYALAGWEQSKGASAEVALAKWRGIPVHYEEVPSGTPALVAPVGTDPKGEIGKTKAPMWLLPPRAMIETAWAMGSGNPEYGAWNWRETRVCTSTYMSAILRHYCEFHEGVDTDVKSKRQHLAHIAANCFILIDAMHHNKLDDDRP